MPDRYLRTDPLPAAYAAKPLTPVEIDQHPDGPRIWATLMAQAQEIVRRDSVPMKGSR